MPAPCTHIAITRIVKSHRAKRLSTYLCEHCGLWLTHQKLKKGRRSKKQMLALTLAPGWLKLT